MLQGTLTAQFYPGLPLMEHAFHWWKAWAVGTSASVTLRWMVNCWQLCMPACLWSAQALLGLVGWLHGWAMGREAEDQGMEVKDRGWSGTCWGRVGGGKLVASVAPISSVPFQALATPLVSIQITPAEGLIQIHTGQLGTLARQCR